MANGPSVNSQGITIPLTTPTAILQLPSPALQETQSVLGAASTNPNSGPQVSIIGVANIMWGSGATSATVQCFDEKGALIAPAYTIPVVAMKTTQVVIGFIDDRGHTVRHTYSVVITQGGTGSVGNGTMILGAGFCQTPG